MKRSVRLIAVMGGLALTLSGCAAAGALFSSNGASAVAGNGGLIVDAVDAITGPSDSYCRKGPAESSGEAVTSEPGAGATGQIPVYKIEAGDCVAGDTEIKSYEYNEIKAKNEALAFQQLHAVAVAQAAEPTYCRTATSHTAYRSSAKTCLAGEETITEEEYFAAKEEAKAAATKLP